MRQNSMDKEQESANYADTVVAINEDVKQQNQLLLIATNNYYYPVTILNIIITNELLYKLN